MYGNCGNMLIVIHASRIMGFKHIINMYKKAKRIYMYAEKRVIMSYGFKVMVDGDYACFTRPEMKVERVSYDVPTPGALEGLLKSVYWKPAMTDWASIHSSPRRMGQ